MKIKNQTLNPSNICGSNPGYGEFKSRSLGDLAPNLLSISAQVFFFNI